MAMASPAPDSVWVTTRTLLAPVVVACVREVANGKVFVRQEGYGLSRFPRPLPDSSYSLEYWHSGWRPVAVEWWSEYRREIDRSPPR